MDDTDKLRLLRERAEDSGEASNKPELLEQGQEQSAWRSMM